MLSNLIVITLVVIIGWFVIISGSDPKRDQQRLKVRRQAQKHWKEHHASNS